MQPRMLFTVLMPGYKTGTCLCCCPPEPTGPIRSNSADLPAFLLPRARTSICPCWIPRRSCLEPSEQQPCLQACQLLPQFDVICRFYEIYVKQASGTGDGFGWTPSLIKTSTSPHLFQLSYIHCPLLHPSAGSTSTILQHCTIHRTWALNHRKHISIWSFWSCHLWTASSKARISKLFSVRCTLNLNCFFHLLFHQTNCYFKADLLAIQH